MPGDTEKRVNLEDISDSSGETIRAILVFGAWAIAMFFAWIGGRLDPDSSINLFQSYESSINKWIAWSSFAFGIFLSGIFAAFLARRRGPIQFTIGSMLKVTLLAAALLAVVWNNYADIQHFGETGGIPR